MFISYLQMREISAVFYFHTSEITPQDYAVPSWETQEKSLEYRAVMQVLIIGASI